MIVKNLLVYKKNGDTLLHNVSFNTKRAEVIAVVGKSGTGKSTLLRAISGRGIQRSGTVEGVKKLGFLYQDGKESLSPAHSILSQAVEYVGDKVGAKKWFSLLGLSNKIHSYSDLLSGGQRMRASLAINMHLRADVLLLDEPTANLDDENKDSVVDVLLSDVRKNKTTLLWVSHDMALVKKIATRVLVLDNGKVVEDSSAKEFFKKPKSIQGQSLLKNRTLNLTNKFSKKVVCHVKNLSAGYKDIAVIENISFDVNGGESLGIYGNSGMGKTTILRVLMGQMPAMSGVVDTPKSIQVIFQDTTSALNPNLPIGVSVVEPIASSASKSVQEKSLKSVLEMVDIDPVQAHRYPHSFSGGERMRICIARAIIAKPDLILADEITSALDSVTAGRVLKTLLDIQKKTGVAIIYVSHDKAMLKQVAHKILKIES